MKDGESPAEHKTTTNAPISPLAFPAQCLRLLGDVRLRIVDITVAVWDAVRQPERDGPADAPVRRRL